MSTYPGKVAPIVVVDDSPDDAFFLKRIFATAGIADQLLVVEDAAEAVKLLSSPAGQAVRVAFIDIRMPGMDGLEFLKWLRAQPSLAQVHAVMLSTSEHPSDLERARELGADGYLVKYPSAHKIATLLAHILDKPLPLNLDKQKPSSGSSSGRERDG
jgi:CheY-like chemotaxis protein